MTFGLDLSKPQNLGQTSGHSFGNLITVNSQGDFIGMDLGDNCPRGLHFHRKWSNDNATYTELGGVVEGRASTSMIFSTDHSPEGRVLDDARVGVPNEPRDVAMLRVVKNFEKAPGGMQVSDALMAGPVPGSRPETGGFYDFGGQWPPQRVTGVIWLTAHAPGEAALAPQVFPRRDGTIAVLWEKTDPAAGLWALVVDEGGRKLGEPMFLGSGLRLGREMLPRRLGSRVFTLASDGGGSRLCFLRDE